MRRLGLALLGVFWPVKATFDASRAVLRYGSRVEALSHIGHCRQWWGAMTLAHAWNYSPGTYYAYRFWDPAIRPLATTYLQVQEMAVLQWVLNERESDVSQDKWVFAARCAEAGIPTPGLVARFGKHEEKWVSERRALPRVNLFVKPVSGMQGSGGERWVYEAGIEGWSRKGRSLAESDLVAHCRQLAQERPFLIQYCLANHPDLERFSAGPLCTFRVMTYGEAGHAPEVLGVTFKIARRGSDVDNVHAGGIACPVDKVTGQLGSGIGMDPTEPRWRKHPETGATLEGACISTHREVIELAVAAHAKLDVPWSVGWDVAMTPEGAVVVEGNTLWAVDVYELPCASGLPDEFAAGLLEQVRKAMAGTA